MSLPLVPPHRPVPRLRRDDALVLVVDLQEAFRDRVPGFEGLVGRTALLVEAARLLDVPVLVTEQYPRGLGSTVGELDGPLGDAERLEKTSFSALGAPGAADALRRAGRSQVVLAGLEAHVCVHQTADDLLARGLDVHLALDAVGSQFPVDREAGIARALGSGAVTSSVETALFELLGTARHPAFRAVQRLITSSRTTARPLLEAR